MTRVAILCAAVLLSACGGSSPSAPETATVNLAGTWTGTWQYTASGASIVETVTFTLTQAGTDATGTWTSQSGVSGQVQHLAANASTSGTLTISQPTITGPACTATAAITGTASATSINLTLAPIAPSGVCQWAAGQQFSLQR
jgi:hypothetical protein